MKIYLLVLVLWIFGLNAHAQTLKGTIKTPSGEGINNASIQILNSSKGTLSDKSGNYSLELSKGKYEIVVSSIGFASQIKTIEINGQGQTLNFTLVESSNELSEVVVTAQKTEQNLLATPIAVSSISAKKVEDARIWELANLTAIVPNYLYSELGVAFQQIQSIRGVQVFSENPAVATYIDDVNALDIIGGGFQMADIERIEVLRGPQGTLFG
ncbi:MAG: carboxypeptidase-like regulatory domain-containing protein, partial [Leadbetterella sp.]|nr:carboxypeptidase-like regulatory domain-containing protein [Leadbetterella sp.]